MVVFCQEMQAFPETITLRPIEIISKRLRVPGSKSLTNRALIISALAHGTSILEGGLVAEDSEVMIRALDELGIPVQVDGTSFTVHGQGGRIPALQASLDLALSGTSIRFLTALVALGRGSYILDGNTRMRQRPIEDLLDALGQLGVEAKSQLGTGCPPVLVEASGLAGGKTVIAGERSSQYLSALLMIAPYAEAPIEIRCSGELQSKPFIDMTVKLMNEFGVQIVREGYAIFKTLPGKYRSRHYMVEGDAMSAGYFWAAAAVTGGRVEVENVGRESLQGDKRIVNVLESMGCRVRWSATSCELVGPPRGALRGGTFDLNDMPDQALTLAVMALFADAPVRIENVSNMRIKETDRLSALATELSKFGVRVDEEVDGLTVYPLRSMSDPLPKAVQIDTYGDHRMAMAFAVAGLRLPNVTIRDPVCVAKTYPTFFDDWTALREVAG
ncbi:MAG: 3-phosphoshikimate 1-carboxyvinyltransferase [Trueperaceae bacterium]|nr:MAG: 3-phosphoshikimate 1-carboxyvinyltransferase [Trueperaceae bacterium]